MMTQVSYFIIYMTITHIFMFDVKMNVISKCDRCQSSWFDVFYVLVVII